MHVASGCFPGAWRRGSWHFQVTSLHLQSIMDYGRQGLLTCVTPVLTSITRGLHCVGRDQAVGRLSTVSMRVKEGVSPAEESFHLGVETHQSATRSCPVLLRPPPKCKNKGKTSYPLSSVHSSCIHTVHNALVREPLVTRFYNGSGILGLRRIRGYQAPGDTFTNSKSVYKMRRSQ